jgi:ADP-ribose pyrophosphatase
MARCSCADASQGIVMKKPIYKGKVITLSLEKRRLPNGVVIDLELIRHPGAVLLVPFLNNGRILLIRQYRATISSYIWEFPAGTIGIGESAIECAKRELIEETGYKAGSVRKLGFVYPAPGYTTEKIFMFRADRLRKVPHHLEGDEVITPQDFTVTQVRRLVRDKKIVDAKSICALIFADLI